jgi:hypothetical protein
MGALLGEPGGGLLFRGPWRFWKEGSGDWYLSLWGLRWATWSDLPYWGLRDMVERVSRDGASLSVGALWREPGGGLPLLGTVKICRKALETGLSFHMGPVLGNLEEGSSTRDLKVWMKGARSMTCLSLSLSRWRGSVGGLGGSIVTGDPGGYVEVSGCGHPSLRGPLCRRETRYVGGGGSYTEALDRGMKEGASGGASLCERFL